MLERAKFFVALSFLIGGVFLVVVSMQQGRDVIAASQGDDIDVNLPINATITNSCDSTVTMNGITGTGQSTVDSNNEATCTVKTNNSSGYSLTFSSATTYLENTNGDQIAAYSPASAGTPEAWSVASSDSEWGARLKSTSDEADTGTWGTSDSCYTANCKWHNVTNDSGFTVVSKTTETDSDGDDEVLQFGAEVGSSKHQPTGTYDVNVTVTATTL